MIWVPPFSRSLGESALLPQKIFDDLPARFCPCVGCAGAAFGWLALGSRECLGVGDAFARLSSRCARSALWFVWRELATVFGRCALGSRTWAADGDDIDFAATGAFVFCKSSCVASRVRCESA